MPFHTNPEDRSLMLEFGFGDLCIANAGIDPESTDEIVVYSDPKRHKIGQVDESHIGKGTDEVHALVRMVFHDIRSLDVLINQARILRDAMERNARINQQDGNAELLMRAETNTLAELLKREK